MRLLILRLLMKARLTSKGRRMFDERTMDNQHNFVGSILALASAYDISVTSWGRTAKRNRMVGGVANSRHLEWCAVDIVLDDNTKRGEVSIAAKALGLEVIAEDDHLH